METATAASVSSDAAPTSATGPPEPSPTQVAETEVSVLESRIKLLSDLSSSVNDLRQIPSQLLRPQSGLSSVLPIPQSEQTRLREEFEKIKSVLDQLRSTDTQDALTSAKESEGKDKTGISYSKRRFEHVAQPSRPQTPESPQPYPSFQPVSSSLFPTWDSSVLPLKLRDISEYIKEYNSTHDFRLHIWTYRRREGADITAPLILRFSIRDVFIVYITLDTLPDGALITESATAFGPREKKPPHSPSDYFVYQNLSQQLVKMIHSQPTAPLQQILSLLESYADLFVRRCTSCQRVVSSEGHVPPVCRIWVSQPAGQGSWDARHTTCPQH